jgi:hypothetical protein
MAKYSARGRIMVKRLRLCADITEDFKPGNSQDDVVDNAVTQLFSL